MPRGRKLDINIEGMEQWVRDLARAQGHLPTMLQTGLLPFIARGIAMSAQASARSQGSTAGKSARDISHAGPEVTYGGQGYSMGAEFGSYQYKQFKPWRGSGRDAGYFLWPAVRDWRDMRSIDELLKRLDREIVSKLADH